MKLVDKLKKYLAERWNLYPRSPVKIRNPLQKGKVSVFETRDLEIDREERLKEEREKNGLPHPME